MELTNEPVKVYNFQAEYLHTYHVSEFGLLVYNAGGYERSQKYSNNWSDESLSKTVDKIAPDPKPVKTSGGKEIVEMKQMAESSNYLILNEYEKVFLKLKATSQLILIGEFYGDPDAALISDDETYCAVGGEGVIIYYLRDPFEEFSTDHKSSNQWKIWGRDTDEETMWVSEIDQIDSKHIRVELEDSETILLSIF